MKKYHIKARQSWEAFSHEGENYCLKHLNIHEVRFSGNKGNYNFVVTYGLHCFTKDGQEYSLPVTYSDNHEERQVHLERYHLSKYLRGFIETLDKNKILFETTREKYFFFEYKDNLTNEDKKCKVCICMFKENRLLRIHVTSAFFIQQETIPNNKSYSIFKIALDTKNKPRNRQIPKEATRK